MPQGASMLAQSTLPNSVTSQSNETLTQLPGIAEMVTFLPVSSPFIRFAGRFVDDAFGVAAGWNFFIFEAALVPFEIVACNVIIGFWSTAVPTGAIIAIVIVLYGYVDVVVCVHDKMLTQRQSY
jgi:amino acid permease